MLFDRDGNNVNRKNFANSKVKITVEKLWCHEGPTVHS